MNIVELLKREFNINEKYINNTIQLIDEGNTIPFIARYRKEATGDMSDVVLRNFYERLIYLRNLKSKKEDVFRLIEEMGKMNEEIKHNILKATTLVEVEDIYAPYKPKKRTRATIAKEKGLEKLSIDLLKSKINNLEEEAKKYLNEEKDVFEIEEAINGALDIISEIISDDSNIRKEIRNIMLNEGVLKVKSCADEKSVYDMYYDYSENIKNIASHRVLAINRGEKEGFLKVKIEIDDSKIIKYINRIYINEQNENMKEYIQKSINDSYKRLVYPSMEREIRNYLSELSHERAIKVFGENVKNLLLQAPIKGKKVIGFDPAFRTGCKIAVIDENGKLLDTTTIYPTAPQNDVENSKNILKNIIDKYDIDLICIGNGTASRESESFVASMLSEIDKDVKYTIVNEAGASVYSASEIANEEYPDINVSLRGAISIGRRIQDPLAELVKIEPKHIGVGQYQHDVNQKRLNEVLNFVVEDAVNSVGVNLNSASFSLLQYVAGINKTVAKNIISYREENGYFKNRNELKKVKRLGDNAFKQCAGFLRVFESENPLDNTGIHPESYDLCIKFLDDLGYTIDDIKNKNIADISKKISDIDLSKLSQKLDIGELTLKDIIKEVQKPGRDLREDNMIPLFKNDILKIEDLREGIILKGTVRNVVDFGAFVDIGIKNDGLVHKSQMSDKFVKNPMDIVSIGDNIDVKVIGIDLQKQKVALSMKII